MPRRCSLTLALLLFAAKTFAADQPLWHEYGLLHTQTTQQGGLAVTSYEMKDVTGALAAWEWLRTPAGRSCNLAPFCTREPGRTIVSDDNYVVVFTGGVPAKAQFDAVLNALPNKHDGSLPPILAFIPRRDLVPDSARYALGPASLQAFAPQLAAAKPGFAEDAEAQIAEYHVAGSPEPIHFALFYYPSPEMARLHEPGFQALPNVHVKRDGVLLGVVFGDATAAQAAPVLSQVHYQAQVTRNETPPPSPIKPLYQLLINILSLSVLLVAICLCAGLMYAGMRIYRRKYGTLEADESMITLHLTVD